MQVRIKSSDLKVMPWKNGLGSTSEIDISPLGSEFRNLKFDWRLSSAQITESNSFSQFPGYDRVLFVLSGAGLILNGKTLKTGEIVRWAGEEGVLCELIEGKVKDLGIIYKRDLYQCDMSVLEFSHKQDVYFSQGIHFLTVLSGDLLENGMVLDRADILKIVGPETVSLASGVPTPAVVLKTSIYKRS